MCTKKSIILKDKIITLDSPIVMAIINITPDSFFINSRANSQEEIINAVDKAINDGAKIIDVGAASTRPNAEVPSEEEEITRIKNALNIIRKKFPEIPISIDTFRAKAADMAVRDFSADMINDISGGQIDLDMFRTIAKLNVPYVLMHTRGTPKTMQQYTQYDDIISDLLKYFSSKIDELRQLGHTSDIIIDLGFGFAKTLEQNYQLLYNQKVFECFKLPILTGISRKSMINKVLNTTPIEALNGTTVLNTIALLNGADILRVHDTKEAVEAIKIVNTLNKNKT